MSSFLSQNLSIPAIGFETSKMITALGYVNDYANARKDYNYAKAAGYIPLIGTVVGIWHLYRLCAVSHQEEFIGNRTSHIIRGCIELLSLGVLFLIPDLIMTIYASWNLPADRSNCDYQASLLFSGNNTQDCTL